MMSLAFVRRARPPPRSSQIRDDGRPQASTPNLSLPPRVVPEKNSTIIFPFPIDLIKAFTKNL
jgi:hypothetical protein